jgi:thioredoxin reductase (NADPH)
MSFRKTPDVAVIGGGPAGVSAALWVKRLGCEPLLLEARERIGGQLWRSYQRSVDCPGFYGLTGREIAERLAEHLTFQDVPFRVASPVESVSIAKREIVTGGEVVAAPALIFALGVEKRRLGVPGEREFAGRGVSSSATRDRHLYIGKEVVIVGGGDGAFEEALMLNDAGCRVTLMHRSDQFRARMIYRDAVLKNPNIRVMTHARITEISGDDAVREVGVDIAPPGVERVTRRLAVSGVFLALGITPATRLVADQVECDADGFIKTDRFGKTSAEGVWACGEVTRPPLPSLVTSFGDGATAAKSAYEWLVRRERKGAGEA